MRSPYLKWSPEPSGTIYINTDHTSALWEEDVAMVPPAHWTGVSAAETLSHWKTVGLPYWALEWAWMGPLDTASPFQPALRLRPDS